MESPVIQTVPLGFQWPTLDPFLFCVHHLDTYPAGDGRLGPAASLDGRSIGNDFEPVDGWRMYHGSHVPGFPQHPHRGFETITFVRRGLIDHSDSLGATARFGRGDVQWMTAGAGIQHAEMFPLLDDDGPNTVEMFQIWMNLPAADKMVDAHFTMLWDDDVPRHVADGTTVTVIAGRLADPTGTVEPPTPPPASYASRPDADVALWHVTLEPGATWTMPAAAGDGVARVLYVFEGDGIDVDGTAVEGSTGAVVDATRDLTITSAGPTEMLVMQGRPIGEPVAQQGPFVMNTEDEIRQAFTDYRATQFGGWPWDTPDPTHGHDGTRFARHADGRIEYADKTPV
ncbi:pirin family protein [Ilumatobacter nonamiensis]|uniref:pirin family protein n=1 Tax=Ilumatobacter nonamiensis TaxID=467093 RepID=UPI000348F3AA|nr:pirin family protein [Ilumatobacter nonamiensis]